MCSVAMELSIEKMQEEVNTLAPDITSHTSPTSPSLKDVILTKFVEQLPHRTAEISSSVYTVILSYALLQPGHIAEVGLLYKLLLYCNNYGNDRELLFGMLTAWMKFGTKGEFSQQLHSGYTPDQIDDLLLDAADLTLRNHDRPAFCYFLLRHYAPLAVLKNEPLFQEITSHITNTLLNDAMMLKLGLDTKELSDLAWYMPREKHKRHGWFARFIAKTLTNEHCMRNYRLLRSKIRRQSSLIPFLQNTLDFPDVFIETYYLHSFGWVDEMLLCQLEQLEREKYEEDEVEEDDVEEDEAEEDDIEEDDIEEVTSIPINADKSWLRWFFGLN